MNIEQWSGYEVSSEVLEQAASWIAMLDSSQDKDFTQVENAAQTLRNHQALDSNQLFSAGEDIHTHFFDWLQADPSHQQAYFELSEMWARSACAKSMSNIIDKSVVLPFPSQSDIPPKTLFTEASFGEQTASPSWAYPLTIGLILCGLLVPAIQSIF